MGVLVSRGRQGLHAVEHESVEGTIARRAIVLSTPSGYNPSRLIPAPPR